MGIKVSDMLYNLLDGYDVLVDIYSYDKDIYLVVGECKGDAFDIYGEYIVEDYSIYTKDNAIHLCLNVYE